MNPKRTCLPSLMLALFLLTPGVPLRGQAVDGEGRLTTSSWLILGPFRQPHACGENVNDLLQNFVAPSAMACLAPGEGDELEYDAFLAASSVYEGPLSDLLLPVWRAFEDGTEDGVQDLQADPGNTCVSGEDGVCQNFVSYLTTYLEFAGPGSKALDLCLAARHGVKVWLNDELVFARAGCDVTGECTRIPVVFPAGPSRLTVASFTGTAFDRLELRLLDGELRILPSHPDWTFHGRERPEGFSSPDCPELVAPVRDLACLSGGGTLLDLTWDNPPGATSEQAIAVVVEGVEAEVLGGEATSTTLDLPPSSWIEGVEVCVENASGHPTCCEIPPLGPVRSLSCVTTGNGSMRVEWVAPDSAIEATPIRIQVDGQTVLEVDGRATEAVIPEGALSGTTREVCVVNASDEPVCCEPGMTDDEGHLLGQAWLVLGPYQWGIECNGRDLSHLLLENFVAPSTLECNYPRFADPMDYQAAGAASTGYFGPVDLDHRPFWRVFDDGSILDGDLDLRADAARVEVVAPADGQLGWLATYFEYRGAGPIEADVVLSVGDSGQVWLDDRVVFNRYECGSREDPEEPIPVTIHPGLHRLLVGVFNAQGEWGARVRLEAGGVALVDGAPGNSDWVFHGRSRPPGELPCGTGNPEICDNGRDDDGDLLVDCEDPDCLEAASCRTESFFRRGDVDGNGRLEVTDPVVSLSYQFLGTFDPDCFDALDFDDSGRIDVTDPISNLQHQFLGTAPPAAPGKEVCGPDPTGDELDCVSQEACP